MTTFITRYETSGPGVRLAVKDLIDMEGEPTTAGCRAVAQRAGPAPRDAACLAGARAAGARIVGRTNLHELALGVTGINPWYGTPVNPLDPTRVPGGSSSGSAVAVATGEADVAYGSDTGGSVRIPAACCGTAGLKTTWGRIPLDGVWPLSPSFDTVGPMARDVGGLVTGMQLLEPGFAIADVWAGNELEVARLPVEADPAINAALDRAVAAVGWRCRELAVPGWDAALTQAGLLLVVEAWQSNRALMEEDPEGIGEDVRTRLQIGASFDDTVVRSAWETQREWQATLERVFTEVDLLITPTLTIFPPPLEDGDDLLVARCTLPVNLAGVPALSLPVPTGGAFPASLQLIGPAMSEERLLAAGAVLEAAIASG
ncbi:MAG TPA: amidase [Acidimicrobiales bacterium]|nr:amidase [Acidimicrobiales bacterium]